jgi:DNA-binding NtrC family response regulator
MTSSHDVRPAPGAGHDPQPNQPAFPPSSGYLAIAAGRPLAEVERQVILATLADCRGNRTHAARLLAISPRSLRQKLAGYSASGHEVPPPESGIRA